MAAEMNGYGLIGVFVQSIAALAWPGAFVLAVYLFREKLVELLPHFRVKHKDWEAGFRLDQAEKEVAALPPAPQPQADAAPTPEEKDRFEQLVKVSPGAAIIEIRSELENAVYAVGLAKDVILPSGTRKPTMLETMRILRYKGLIDSKTSAILDDLRHVANTAAHRQADLSESDARRYKKLADEVLARLKLLLA